jgi:hypothetical protein
MLQERAAARGVKLPGKAASDPKDPGKVLTDLRSKRVPQGSLACRRTSGLGFFPLFKAE